MDLLTKHIKEVNQACHNNQVIELFVFGSILTERFSPDSDIDFIVSIGSTDPIEYGENYFQLKFELEKIFNRKIDLLEKKAIRNELFKKLVDQKKKLVYARGNKGLA